MKDIGWGSHLPVLIRMTEKTNGPILELGSGLYSTPFLHWACLLQGRKLRTIDNNKSYFEEIKQYESDWHKVEYVTDWNLVELDSYYSFAFIDHAPSKRRIEEIKRLADLTDYIVVHDTENRNERKYRYFEIYPLFKHCFRYEKTYPQTSVLSNKNDPKLLFD